MEMVDIHIRPTLLLWRLAGLVFLGLVLLLLAALIAPAVSILAAGSCLLMAFFL